MYPYNGLDYTHTSTTTTNKNHNLYTSATNYKQKTAENINNFIITPSATTTGTTRTTSTKAINSHKFNNKHFSVVMLFGKTKAFTSSYSSLNSIKDLDDNDDVVVVDSNSRNNDDNIAYVSNLLKRIKRLAQPRILRVKSSHAGGMGSGYNRRNKDFRFGKCLIMIMGFFLLVLVLNHV